MANSSINKPLPTDIVYVKWLDSGSVDGVVWQFRDDWECSVHTCETVGVLVSKDDAELVLAQSMNEDQWGRLFAIPSKSIVDYKILRVKEQTNDQL